MSAQFDDTDRDAVTARLKLVTASWISVAMMLSCVIYLAAVPGTDIGPDTTRPHHNGAPKGTNSISSVYYLA